MCRCTLVLEYETDVLARAVFDAVNVDNEEFIETHLEGTRITATCRARTPLALRNTLDDFLACAQLAEKSGLAASPEST